MKLRKIWLAGAAAAFLAGCASVDEQGARMVNQPNMQFSRSVAYASSSKLMPQFLPGLPASGGDQPSSCALCR